MNTQIKVEQGVEGGIVNTGVHHSNVTIYDARSLREKAENVKIRYEINWPCLGGVTVDEARIFAKAILTACDWAEQI